MPSYVTPKKNTAYVFYTSLEAAAGGTFQANPTLAAGDVLVATDDGAPGNITTLPTVDADFTKRIKVSLSATEMNGDHVTVLFSDALGGEWLDTSFEIDTSTYAAVSIGAGATAEDLEEESADAVLNEAAGAHTGLITTLVRSATPANALVIDAAGLADANVVKLGPSGSGAAQTAGDLVGELAKVPKSDSTVSWNATALAAINAEVVDVLRTDTIPDSYAADGAQPSFAQAVLAIQQYLFERSVSNVTVTVKKPDGVATALTFTLNDGTTPSSITRAS